jgi:predicted nucleotidyltransferase
VNREGGGSDRAMMIDRMGRPCEHDQMDLGHGIDVSDEAVASFCVEHGVKRLALFGSVLGDRFTEGSDLDVLVEFEIGRTPGLLTMAAMELELETLLGHRVDLRTYGDLSRYFRDQVAAEARPIYAA